MRPGPADAEYRHDGAARRRDRGCNRPEPRAIAMDGEGTEVALRIQAVRVGIAGERDGLGIEEARATGGQEVGTDPVPPRWQMRELRPRSGRDVQRDDLSGLFASGIRRQIGVDDGMFIWTE